MLLLWIGTTVSYPLLFASSNEYFANVNKALKNNDPSVLNKYKNLKIVDSEGKEHYFKIDLEKLYEIMDAQIEPEFLDIYKH